MLCTSTFLGFLKQSLPAHSPHIICLTLEWVCAQNAGGLDPGSEEDDGGMYIEEQELEQYEYTDDPAGQEGMDDDDPQGSNAQTDLQVENESAEHDVEQAAEGDDDVGDEADAPSDYAVSHRLHLHMFQVTRGAQC